MKDIDICHVALTTQLKLNFSPLCFYFPIWKSLPKLHFYRFKKRIYFTSYDIEWWPQKHHFEAITGRSGKLTISLLMKWETAGMVYTTAHRPQWSFTNWLLYQTINTQKSLSDQNIPQSTRSFSDFLKSQGFIIYLFLLCSPDSPRTNHASQWDSKLAALLLPWLLKIRN